MGIEELMSMRQLNRIQSSVSSADFDIIHLKLRLRALGIGIGVLTVDMEMPFGPYVPESFYNIGAGKYVSCTRVCLITVLARDVLGFELAAAF